jgi:hypothetical protein
VRECNQLIDFPEGVTELKKVCELY